MAAARPSAASTRRAGSTAGALAGWAAAELGRKHPLGLSFRKSDVIAMSALIHAVDMLHPTALDDIVSAAGYSISALPMCHRLGSVIERHASDIAVLVHLFVLIVGHGGGPEIR